MSELRDHYEIGIGGLDVDLTDLDLPTGRTDLDIDVGLGEAVVYVPEGTCVTSDVEIGAGAADVFDRDYDGVDVAFAQSASPPAGRPVLHIDADVGVGVLEVVREGSLPDLGRHRQRFEIFEPSRGRPVRGRDRVRVRRVDRTSLVAGLVITVAGLILLLDRLDAIDVDLGYGLPLLIAAVGAILLTAGLEGPRTRD